MAQYLARVGDQAEGWFGNIRAKKAAPRLDEHGRPVSTRPEDMFQIVQLQVSIAREHALKSADDGGQHVATVVLRCLEELRGLRLCGNQTSGAPRHRRDVVSVAAPARWRGDSTPSTRRCPRGRVGSP